jgi:prepilin-type processing-associated H-X9-DG protein
MHNGQAMPQSRGATLIELLVVLVLVGLLVGLLLPAVQQSRQSARRLTCQSNLRQWAVAVQSYASANKRCLPGRGQGVQPTEVFDRPLDWFNALPPYIEHEPLIQVKDALPFRGGEASVWMCPDMQDLGRPIYFSYGMNMWLSPTIAKKPDQIDKVGPTSTMVFMSEGVGTQCSLVPSSKPYSPVARHGGYLNIAFLDGHVASFSEENVGCGVGDPKRPNIRWVVPDSDWSGPSG